MTAQIKQTLESLNQMGKATLPGHLGIVVTSISDVEVIAELPVQPFLLAPNGYLHAGSVITLADTATGYGCWASLPEGATGFTTIELKSNHLSTAREGTIYCVANAIHRGKTTQVWDAVVKNKANDQTIAMFRCTQMILYPKK
jgi:uncharacterized protein (TIGR00369 family)